MAKGFKHGVVGVALNFKVVDGTVAPSNPKENCLWVNTNTKINGWCFSATKPSRGESGMVWFATGRSSVAQFDALKKNSLMCYPMMAYQYISGSWVSKTCKIYQNGKWQELWDGTLFDKGNQYASITGGWVLYGYKRNNSTEFEGDSSSINGNSITLGGSSYTEFFCGTKNAIDLTQYEFIEINVLNEGTSYSSTGRVYVANPSDPQTPIAQKDIDVGTNYMDVSALEGEYIVGASMYNYNWDNSMEFNFVKLGAGEWSDPPVVNPPSEEPPVENTSVELYGIGDQHTDLTGGWSGSGWSDYANAYTENSATIGTSGIDLKTSANGNRACVCGTVNKVNFNGCNTIAVTVTSFSYQFFVGICPGKQFWDDEGDTPMLALTRIFGNGTTYLAIPEGIDSAYVLLYGFSETGATTFGTVSKVEMMK